MTSKFLYISLMLSGFLVYTVSGIIAWQFAIPEKDAIKRVTNAFMLFSANIRKSRDIVCHDPLSGWFIGGQSSSSESFCARASPRSCLAMIFSVAQSIRKQEGIPPSV